MPAAWHSRAYAGEPPASLEGVARFCLRNGYALNIEIKPTPGREARDRRVVAEQAARLWRGRRAAAAASARSSRSRSPRAQAAAPDMPRALLLDSLRAGWLDEAQALGCVAVVTAYPLMDAERARPRCMPAGLRALCYTVNDPAEAARLAGDRHRRADHRRGRPLLPDADRRLAPAGRPLAAGTSIQVERVHGYQCQTRS